MSGQKIWDQMSQAEKIEELHDALTRLQNAHDYLGGTASQTQTSLKEVGRAVEALQKRLDQANLPLA